jgi:hypothetical protein
MCTYLALALTVSFFGLLALAFFYALRDVTSVRNWQMSLLTAKPSMPKLAVVVNSCQRANTGENIEL